MWDFENQFLPFHKGTFRKRVVVKNDVTLQAAILMQKSPQLLQVISIYRSSFVFWFLGTKGAFCLRCCHCLHRGGGGEPHYMVGGEVGSPKASHSYLTVSLSYQPQVLFHARS